MSGERSDYFKKKTETFFEKDLLYIFLKLSPKIVLSAGCQKKS